MGQKIKLHFDWATHDDFSKIISLETKIFSESQVSYHDVSESRKILMARDDNNLVGYLDYHEVGDEVEILSIAVDPRFQRKGIATRLFKHVENVNPRLQKIFLELRKSNETAFSFYKNLGFFVYGERKKYYKGGEDALLMKKDVQPR